MRHYSAGFFKCRRTCLLWAGLLIYTMLMHPAALQPTPASAQEEMPLLFLEDPWPPWTLGDYGKPEGGIAINLTRSIFGKLQKDVEFQLYPWKRVLRMVESGQADGIMMIQHEPSKEKYLAFSDMLFESRSLVYYRHDRLKAFSWNNYSDFKELTIGLIPRYDYGSLNQSINKLGLRVEYARTPKINMHRLFAGRVDLVICDEAVANSILRDNPQWKDAIHKASGAVSSIRWHLGISRQSQAFAMLPEINRTIAEMKADGTIDKILGRIN